MHILIATDGSEDANAAIDLLASLPPQAGRHLFVMTVVPTSPVMGAELRPPDERDNLSLSDAAHAIVADAVSRLEAQGHAASGIVRLGNPVDEILDSVDEERINLVVLGGKGIGRVRRFLVGSVAERVSRQAPCSVLAVRQPAALANALIVIDGAPSIEAATVLHQALAGDRIEAVMVLEMNSGGDSSAGADAAQHLAASGINARVLRVSGEETEAILQQAEASGATLIIIGSGMQTSVDFDGLSRTAYTLLQEANCSILIGR